ncbi:MAG: PKD domain-containing protein [Methanomicrobiales archaeon]
MNTEDALSRNSIIVIVVSIILIVAAAGVMIFFSSSPDKVPRMNATVEASGNVVYLYHDGGDQFPKDRLLIRINGEDITESQVSLLHAQEWPWTAGKTIKVQYSGSSNPETVDVIYRNGQKQTVVVSQQLHSSTPVPVTTTTTVVPTMPVSTPLPTEPGVTPEIIIPVETPYIPHILPITMVIPQVTPAPPRADFAAMPTSGQLPLNVQFTDLSKGIPTKWTWNFGDGSVSSERTPVHKYTVPGSYTVSLVVENKFGSDKKSVPGYISAGISPIANFAASPRDGAAPLEVHFTDLSTGQPVVWSWNFGDGMKSSEANPTHIYSYGGSYPVVLTVANSYGADTRIQNAYISTTTPTSHDVYLYGSTSGYLAPEGYITFTVTTTDSWIKIAGKIYRFTKGDDVQLVIMDPSSGVIDGSSSAITGFSFNSVDLYVNGVLVQKGIVPSIDITGYQNYRSSTTLIIPAGDSTTVFFADGRRTLISPGQQVIIKNFKPDSTGRMVFTKTIGEVFYKGGAESWQLV